MSELARRLEAVLFVASEPLPLDRLADATETSTEAVEAALLELEAHLADGGIQLTRHNDAFRLVTAPETSELIRSFLVAEARTELTKPALEALAIIAYRGPMTKTALDEIRGVSSDATLRNLQQRGLVVEQGTANEPGKPLLFAVSQAFLQEFGFSSLADLPVLAEAEPS